MIMATATVGREEEVMTNQQFDAILKMVLNVIDSAGVSKARDAIVDMMIDRDDRDEYKKTLQERKARKD
jgi:hypothetical protein